MRLTLPQRINFSHLKSTHLNINLAKEDTFTETVRIFEQILSRYSGPAMMTHSLSNHGTLDTEPGRQPSE